MSYTVTMSDLRHKTPAERERALSELVARARNPRDGNRAVLDAKIRAFEERYEMTSHELLAALHTGHQKETADISLWLFWLKARGTGGR